MRVYKGQVISAHVIEFKCRRLRENRNYYQLTLAPLIRYPWRSYNYGPTQSNGRQSPAEPGYTSYKDRPRNCHTLCHKGDVVLRLLDQWKGFFTPKYLLLLGGLDLFILLSSHDGYLHQSNILYRRNTLCCFF